MNVRIGSAGCLVLAVLATVASAADWANQAFENRHHNFGTVARAAKTEHLFEFTNPFGEPLHVSSVRASCGCTTPIVVTDTVQPGEKGQILARFNTRSFVGQRGATLTVVFDRPQYGEAQLRVDGYVRRDVVCNPGELDFGTVVAGERVERVIDIQYAGRGDWEILAATSSIPGLTLNIQEESRSNGRVGYALKAEFVATAGGYVNGEIELTTNDGSRKAVPLVVAGKVVEPIAVSPSPLLFGSVNSSESVAKKLILRGESEFRILAINCDDDRITWDLDDEAKKLHIIPVHFNAGQEAGPFSCRLEIMTDCEAAKCVEVRLEAQVAGQE